MDKIFEIKKEQKEIVEKKIISLITITLDKSTASNLADSISVALSGFSGSELKDMNVRMLSEFLRVLKEKLNSTTR